MIPKSARTLAASLAAAFALSTVAVGRAAAQQRQPAPSPVAPAAAQDQMASAGPRLEPQQQAVSGRAAFRQGSNAYRADTVVITASTLALVALVVLLLLIL